LVVHGLARGGVRGARNRQRPVRLDDLTTAPARSVALTAIVVAMWAAIALKGAAAGRFKPGDYLGLRVY
jgi:hypothetical protein